VAASSPKPAEVELGRWIDGSARGGRPLFDAAFKVFDVSLKLLEREAERKQLFELARRELRKLLLAGCAYLRGACGEGILHRLQRRRRLP
jgi:hypothetical protein